MNIQDVVQFTGNPYTVEVNTGNQTLNIWHVGIEKPVNWNNVETEHKTKGRNTITITFEEEVDIAEERDTMAINLGYVRSFERTCTGNPKCYPCLHGNCPLAYIILKTKQELSETSMKMPPKGFESIIIEDNRKRYSPQ